MENKITTGIQRIFILVLLISCVSFSATAQNSTDLSTAETNTGTHINGSDTAAEKRIPVLPESTNESTNVETTPKESAPPAQCFPNCRSGYFCHIGQCISKCNPACDTGFECSDDSRCVSSAPTPAPEIEPNVYQNKIDARAAREARQEQIKKKRHELRRIYRKVPRFTVNAALGGGIVTGDSNFMAFTMLTLGFKKNIRTHFGIQARAGGGFGVLDTGLTTYDEEENPVGTPVGFAALCGDAGVFFGPFNRFYIGPYGWFAYVDPAKESVTGLEGTFDVPHGPIGGGGIDMGLRFGKREQFDVNWRVQSSFTSVLPLAIVGGISYHFMKK